MKLLTYENNTGEHCFGVLLGDSVASFETLQRKRGRTAPELADISAYLTTLPESFFLARELADWGTTADLSSEEILALDRVRLLPAVPCPPALFDFGLSPKHLLASALTMNRYERKWPGRIIADFFVKRQFRTLNHRPNLRFYKGNHHSIIGDMESPVWPGFTSYLDIEPELGIVTGRVPYLLDPKRTGEAVAGYVIFNDFSARDIQFPEMLGMLGPSRSKDFERGNGLGPYLVTPDEVPDPLSLSVRVKVGDREPWTGTTSDYSAHPLNVVEFLTRFRSLAPGTVIGMGTVPGCCGLDRDEWIRPGELVEITIEKLGTLRHPIPRPSGPRKRTRWKVREELRAEGEE